MNNFDYYYAKTLNARQRKRTKKDKKKAFKGYLKAANCKDKKAMLKVAQAYETGNGTRLDKKQAIQWYLKAAQKGEDTAMCKVADALETHTITTKKLRQAKFSDCQIQEAVNKRKDLLHAYLSILLFLIKKRKDLLHAYSNILLKLIQKKYLKVENSEKKEIMEKLKEIDANY